MNCFKGKSTSKRSLLTSRPPATTNIRTTSTTTPANNTPSPLPGPACALTRPSAATTSHASTATPVTNQPQHPSRATSQPTRIGEEIAAARALSDLAHQLLSDAAGQIEGITHKRAHLSL
jgi:hypothetical protein